MRRTMPSAMPITECDVLISGAGPVGLALAGRLQAQGVRCLLLEDGQSANTRPLHDRPPLDRPPLDRPPLDRPIALSWGSRLLLQRLGAWQRLSADACSAIQTVHVSQAGHFGQTRIHASDLQQPALGYVASYGSLVAALSQQASDVPRLQARLIDPPSPHENDAALSTAMNDGYRLIPVQRQAADAGSSPALDDQIHQQVRARLLVIAEGESANTLRRDYQQTALVFTVRAEGCPAHTAWERFTAQGPLALLPALSTALIPAPSPAPLPAPSPGQDRNTHHGATLAVVWAMSNAEATRRMALPQPALLQALQQAWGDRYARLQQLTPCVSFPLRLSQASTTNATAHGTGVLRIGNAAQTLHPVAGQGFNLGLRDAWELAQAIADCSDIASLGEAAFCQRYLATRRSDRRLIVGLTDGLARGFLAQAAPLPALRGLGLAALNGLRPLRNSFARRLMHGWRALP